MRAYDSIDLRHRRQVLRQQIVADRRARQRARRIRRAWKRDERRARGGVSGRRLAIVCLSLVTGIAVDPSHPWGVVIAFTCMGIAICATVGIER